MYKLYILALGCFGSGWGLSLLFYLVCASDANAKKAAGLPTPNLGWIWDWFLTWNALGVACVIALLSIPIITDRIAKTLQSKAENI